MIQEAIEIIKQGSPSDWPKAKANKAKVNRLHVVYVNLTGQKVECPWCARVEMYRHLKKWLEGHGHL